MPFMLQMVMVRIGGCGFGWIGGSEGQEVVVGELAREGS